ncbi:hypothetical protein AB0M45_21945 [Nocardia sp. NPDC051787]|uniref:hypothetical protein n=1 Tax=Nocardia sp. NPDC051787 TaxID=3155415 RepID=UPI0034397C8A
MNSLAMYQLLALSDTAAKQEPILPFTLGRAHEVMRVHVACRMRLCPRKAAARQVLIDRGRMMPDNSKPQ